MVDVPEHLVPRDGLTNSMIKFIRLEVSDDGGEVEVVFGLYDEDQYKFGEYSIPVQPKRRGKAKGNIDSLVAQGHREMTNVLRQWLYMMNLMRQVYETAED